MPQAEGSRFLIRLRPQKVQKESALLELKPQSDLTFSTRQHLSQRPERTVGDVLLRLHSRWILTIQEIKEFE
jgi:hypothetical protein